MPYNAENSKNESGYLAQLEHYRYYLAYLVKEFQRSEDDDEGIDSLATNNNASARRSHDTAILPRKTENRE